VRLRREVSQSIVVSLAQQDEALVRAEGLSPGTRRSKPWKEWCDVRAIWRPGTAAAPGCRSDLRARSGSHRTHDEPLALRIRSSPCAPNLLPCRIPVVCLTGYKHVRARALQGWRCSSSSRGARPTSSRPYAWRCIDNIRRLSSHTHTPQPQLALLLLPRRDARHGLLRGRLPSERQLPVGVHHRIDGACIATETAAWLACRKRDPLNKPGHHPTCRRHVVGLWTYGEYPIGREFSTAAGTHAAPCTALQPNGVRARRVEWQRRRLTAAGFPQAPSRSRVRARVLRVTDAGRKRSLPHRFRSAIQHTSSLSARRRSAFDVALRDQQPLARPATPQYRQRLSIR
jgi:hypothetical protein